MKLKQPEITEEEPTDEEPAEEAPAAVEQYRVQPFPEGQPVTPCPELAIGSLESTESRGVFTVGMS